LGNPKRDIGKKFALPERFAKILNRKVIHSAKVRKRRQAIMRNSIF
jgi:lysine/ornithine N-monooxygenase